jgi:hypothetical protein
MTPNIFVRKEVLQNVSLDYETSLINIVNGLGYTGNPTYISPNTVWGLTNCLLFIPKEDTTLLPNDEILSEGAFQINAPEGLRVLAPGSNLSKIYEKIMNVTFSSSSLNFLKENIRKIIIEELELVKNIQLELEFSKVLITIKGSIFHEITDDKDVMLGDPLIASLACSVAKITRKPVKIENIEKNDRDKIINVTLKISD